MKNFLLGLIVFVFLLVLMFGVVLLEHTVVDWWIPACAAAFIAVATIPITVIIRSKKGLKTGVTTYLIHLAAAGIIAFTGIMSLNHFLPGTNEHHEDGIVVQKYTKTRNQGSGRRGRRMRKVTDYYICVQLPDSTRMEQSVSIERYNHIRSGAKIDLTVRTGFLGWRIVN